MTHGIFVGLSTIDIVYYVDEFPAPNTKVAAYGQYVFVGGPAANAAIAFAHLGGQATLVTAVGRHPLAHVIRRELENYSIRLVDLNPDFEDAPVLSSAAVNRNGRRSVVSANATRIPTPSAEADRDLCGRAAVVLVDGHYMPACQAWAAAAKDRGVPVVLDGGSWKNGTKELLKCVHTAICSADFLPPRCSLDDDVMRFLESFGIASIAITHGAEPIQFVSGQSSGIMRVPRVEAIDTLGAGDIFHGAYCYYASIGFDFAEALAEAAKIAAESCRFMGAREWMKSF